MGKLACVIPAFIFGALAVAMGLFSLFYEYWAQYQAQVGYVWINFGLFISCRLVTCTENDLNEFMIATIALLISGITFNLLALLVLCYGVYKESKKLCTLAGSMWIFGCILSVASASVYTYQVLTDQLDGVPIVPGDVHFGTSWDVAYGSAGLALIAGVAAILAGQKIEDGFAPSVLPTVTQRDNPGFAGVKG